MNQPMQKGFFFVLLSPIPQFFPLMHNNISMDITSLELEY